MIKAESNGAVTQPHNGRYLSTNIHTIGSGVVIAAAFAMGTYVPNGFVTAINAVGPPLLLVPLVLGTWFYYGINTTVEASSA